MNIEVGVERIDGLDEVRARLGDSGRIRRDVADTLNQAARIGAQSARIYAPKRSGGLASSIHEDNIQLSAGQAHIEASFGVPRVYSRDLKGRFASGSQRYPIYVHEGTGIYGRLHRMITPRRAKHMVFVGRTGLVMKTAIRGQRAQPFMREAFEDARVYIEAHLDDMLRGLID